ncbi:hypothetical protein JVU11DRAFT_7713 [Chiua virens]|nr:hypothetical protein JVU11DRAFT_7713 [Chiua virens]
MFNNSSQIDASHSTFSEVHRDQYYNTRSTVQGDQTINTIIHGNQILQDSHSNLIEALQKASAPSAAHDSAQRYPAPKCIEGTRVELLARITSWADEKDERPICWLSGRPGSGKSAVSQTIAEKYAAQKRLAASFFFSRRDLERRTTQHVAATLATQLLAFLPSIRPAVIAALEDDYMIPMKVLREQVEKLLVQPLSTATETPDAPVFIIVDALDECDDESLVLELVTLLALLPRKISLPLRLMITSRAEPWLQAQFQQPHISPFTLPLEIHAFSAEADIRSFLRHALDDAYDQHIQIMEHLPRPWPSQDELERIVTKAGGLFIFALTVAKFVGDRMHNPVERLQAILEDTAAVSTGSAYFDLDSLYRDAISVFPDPDVARLVLGVVYCMAIPLSVSGLHELLKRPDVDARMIVPALNSVLLASEDGKQPIQFYHASFRDFLINPQRSQKYAINPDAYHRLMAQLCFENMSNSLRRDMCHIGYPATANKEVLDLVERRGSAYDEALCYACRFWSRHLAQLPGDGVANEGLFSALQRFTTTALLYWMEALSIFGELESAAVMLREGISWLKTLHEPPKDALALLEDAERFVVFYMDPISQCALHVYLTAMAWVPANSVVYKTFKHQSLDSPKLHPERRGEWPTLRRAINLNSPIYSVVFSPNGLLIATAGMNQGVQLWNVITGGNVASLGDRSSTSRLVRFSPSGTFLAAAFEDGTVAVWDPKVGREHLKHEGCHTERITCLEFSNNNTLLASGSRDRAIQVWSMETAHPLYRLATHEGPVTSLAFSSDSLRLVSGSEDNLIIIWDMTSGKIVRGLMGHRKPVNCVAISQDGSTLASGSEDKSIKIWDSNTGKCTLTFSKGHRAGVRTVHFFDDDKHLVTTCGEVVISWNLGSRNTSDILWSADQLLKKSLRRAPAWQTKVIGWSMPKPVLRYILQQTYAESPPQHILTAYAMKTSSFVFTYQTFLFDGSLPTHTESMPFDASGPFMAVALSSDGNWTATGDALGSLLIHDLTMVQGRGSWDELETAIKAQPFRTVEQLVPSPLGTRFLVDSLLQWHLIDEKCHVIKKLDMGMLGSMRDDDDIRFKFSADGSIFICVIASLLRSDKSTVRVFDSVTGEQRTQFTGLRKVHSFTASNDGAYIACGHGSGQVDILAVASGKRTTVVPPTEPNDVHINALAFSDDARELVGGSKSGVARVWDRASGECKTTFGESTSMVTSLAFANVPAGGARIAIGREDGSFCVWLPASSSAFQVIHLQDPVVPHSESIASSSQDEAATEKVKTSMILTQFSEDRSKLFARREDGTIFSWAMTVPLSCDVAASEGAVRDELPQAGYDSNASTTSTPQFHLLSQSDPAEAVDNHFHTAFRVRKDGWLVKGDRRVIWLPPHARPRGKDTLYGYESGLVVLHVGTSSLLIFKCVDE